LDNNYLETKTNRYRIRSIHIVSSHIASYYWR